MKKALLVIAHGSRRNTANDEVAALADRIAAKAGGRYQQVSACFLELATPSIEQAIETAIGNGAIDITLFPYFLSAGQHVANDIPEVVDLCQRRHPQVVMNLLPHLGQSLELVDLIDTLVD